MKLKKRLNGRESKRKERNKHEVRKKKKWARVLRNFFFTNELSLVKN